MVTYLISQKSKLTQKLSKLYMSKFASKWMILVLDLLLSTFSFIIAYFIVVASYPKDVQILPLWFLLLYNLLVCSWMYIFFRIHQGVIRYSSYQEIGRITAAVFSSNGILWLSSFMIPSHSLSMMFSLLIKNATLTFFVLVIFRYIIVRIHIYLTNSMKGTSNPAAIIMGTEIESVALCNLLKYNPVAGFNIIGFMTDDIDQEEQLIMNLPVFPNTQGMIEKLKTIQHVEAIIFPTNELLIKEKERVVDQAIHFNMNIMLSQLPKNWILNDEVISGRNTLRPIQIEDLLGRDEIQIDVLSIREALSNKVILITGAAGSIGSELVKQIASFNPKRILLLDAAETPLYEIKNYMNEHYPDVRTDAIIGDVRFRDHLEKIFMMHHPHVIFHAAAYKHVPMMELHPSEAVLTNVGGTMNMADLALKYRAETFVMISTDKAVNPTNVMGASKRLAEIYVQSLANKKASKCQHLRFITTRFGNVLGSNGSVIPRFKEQLEKGGPLTVTDPNVIRYFMTIPEACRLVLEASTKGENEEIYVFDMGEPVKIDTLARNMIRLAGFVPDKDIQIVYTGLRPGEKLYEELLTPKEFVKPTKHPKIKIAQVQKFEYDQVKTKINELLFLAQKMETFQVVRKMKELIPEFKSMNSEYEKIDHEMNAEYIFTLTNKPA